MTMMTNAVYQTTTAASLRESSATATRHRSLPSCHADMGIQSTVQFIEKYGHHKALVKELNLSSGAYTRHTRSSSCRRRADTWPESACNTRAIRGPALNSRPPPAALAWLASRSLTRCCSDISGEKKEESREKFAIRESACELASARPPTTDLKSRKHVVISARANKVCTVRTGSQLDPRQTSSHARPRVK
ncbi:unnamed protein product [Trichogramma brassicae]|uniref:Uncharacterized protein n=1 Tax=Trichogramma brassicae TaxID=86971 RepID=A0A6H5IZA6_9HYME|nr:unnamed protein product [Trichogramma brassicae]